MGLELSDGRQIDVGWMSDGFALDSTVMDGFTLDSTVRDGFACDIAHRGSYDDNQLAIV